MTTSAKNNITCDINLNARFYDMYALHWVCCLSGGAILKKKNSQETNLCHAFCVNPH